MEYIIGGLILAAIVVYFIYRSKDECTHLTDHDFPDMIKTPLYVPEKMYEKVPPKPIPKTLADVIKVEAPAPKVKKPRRPRPAKIVAPSPEILSVYKDPVVDVNPAKKPRRKQK
jgi:hypothetical protein